MKVEKIALGWRIGFIAGPKMGRLWLGKFILTFWDGLGPMRAY